jgi:hypothetical protein
MMRAMISGAMTASVILRASPLWIKYSSPAWNSRTAMVILKKR